MEPLSTPRISASCFAAETLECLDALARFYTFETVPLGKAALAAGLAGRFVPQPDLPRLAVIP